MTINLEIPAFTLTDRQLIERHLGGDRDAFRQIVERHQGMVCALGLSACGDIARSEDFAQEVFVAAWKQLPELREPEKLRGWLAGIARNLIHNSFRRAQRTPTARAEELSIDTPSVDDSPREQAISADEASLMWSALESIPETYREPIVLFYREGRSAAAVAATFEISEELVRQRLARGRAMLTERMAKLVEETLERSAPTPAFAGAVLLALPLGGPAVIVATETGVAGTKWVAGGYASKAATTAGVVGAAASKGGMAVKALAVVGVLPAVISGALGFLRFRTDYEAAETPARRRQIAVAHLSPLLIFALVVLTYVALDFLGRPGFPLANTPLQSGALQLLLLLIIVLFALVWLRRWRKRMETVEGLPEYRVSSNGAMPGANVFEYRSQRSFLGLPLVHVYVGGPEPVMQRKARGWIAVSDGIALGGFFASGTQLAVAPLSLGCCSVGVISIGCLSAGIAAAGLFAAGVVSIGACALGLTAAKGGVIAATYSYAKGEFVWTTRASDVASAAHFQEHYFFRFAEGMWQVSVAAVWLMWLIPLCLIGWHLWKRRTAK